MSPRIVIDGRRIADFCRAHHVRKLALVGSVLREDFDDASDVDVLPGFAMVRLQDELSGIIVRKVDLHTPGSLSRYFRLENSEPIWTAIFNSPRLDAIDRNRRRGSEEHDC